MLYLKNFTKSYSGHSVIEIPQIEFKPGVYWIKGENGSGKTTLFKSLAGLHPCQGEIRFDDGIDLHDQPVEFRRLVNYAEAEPVYPGFLTARDLIHFVGKAKNSSQQQRDSLTTKFGINAYAENSCETYSSGMLKKVSLSLAFMGAPRLIILDEPLITLDESARKVLFDLIKSYTAEYKAIVLLSSHQLLEDSSLQINQILSIQNKTLQPA